MVVIDTYRPSTQGGGRNAARKGKVMRYNVTIYVNDGNGKTEIAKGAVEFQKKPGDYGNGYHMGVEGLDEPFHMGCYDIRYDKTFRADNALAYIVQFFSDKYCGDGAWKLVGIRVHEAEED